MAQDLLIGKSAFCIDEHGPETPDSGCQRPGILFVLNLFV